MKTSTRRHRGGRPRAVKPQAARPAGPPRRPKGLIWSGTISFGLVNIPVTLHSGESAKELHFTMLDRRDLSPIGYRKVNKTTGEEVPAASVVKGFKLEDGRYVTLTDEDFKRASPERTQRIDIRAFVDGTRIDPAYFDRPYYLEPSAKHEKAYALLREALKRSGKVGIATIVLRSREYVAALMARGPALTLELLRYREELRDPTDLHLPPEDAEALRISESELAMAARLIEDLSGPWKPEAFKDEYRDELLAFIEKKTKAGKAEAGPPAPEERVEGTPAGDIMTLLKKSLERRPKARS